MGYTPINIKYLPVGMARVDEDGRILKVNNNLLDMLGYSEAELTHYHLSAITYKADLVKINKLMARINKNELEAFQGNINFIKKNKESIEVALNISYDLHESTSGYYTLQFQDIHSFKHSVLDGDENIYKSLYENSLNAILLTKPDGRILWANPAACEMFNYTEEELLKIGRGGIMDTSDDKLYELLDERRNTGKASGELTAIKKNGDKFTVHVSTASFRDDSGELATIVSFIDISYRKKSEEALNHEKARILNILEGTEAGTWEWNVQTGEVIYNDKLIALLGYDRNELKQMGDNPCKDLIHPNDIFPTTRLLAKCISQKTRQYEAEFRMKHKNGQWVWILSRGKILQWTDDGKPLWMFGIHMDISVSKELENQLRTREQKYRAIFNSTFQFIAVLDVDGTIIDINEAALEFIGGASTEIIGQKFWDLPTWKVNEDTANDVKKSVEKAAQGEYSRYEVEIFDRNNQPVPILYNIRSLRNKEGEIYRLIPEGIPIPEIVEARKLQLRKNEEMQKFASTAAHDLKEPVRMIGSFLKLLKKNYTDELDENAIKYIDFAVDGAERMQVLINELLEYAKIGSDGVAYELIDLNVLVKNVTKLFELIIREKNAKIHYENLPKIYGQETGLKLVFQNLISNALKYSDIGKPSEIHIHVEEQHSFWEISIHDNGIGIDEEKYKEIFKIFHRLHSKHDIPGTGLGLAMCEKIVLLHNGTIWVESEPNGGSTFHFTISKTLTPKEL